MNKLNFGRLHRLNKAIVDYKYQLPSRARCCTLASHFELAAYRHPQNRKYITYCNATIRVGPSHGHGQHASKIW